MATWDSYTQKATPEDNDTLMIKDTAGAANKRTPFSGVWNWIVNKLTSAVISNLQTNSKSIIPAINELNSKITTIKLSNIDAALGWYKMFEMTYDNYNLTSLLMICHTNSYLYLANARIRFSTTGIDDSISKVYVVGDKAVKSLIAVKIDNNKISFYLHKTANLTNIEVAICAIDSENNAITTVNGAPQLVNEDIISDLEILDW